MTLVSSPRARRLLLPLVVATFATQAAIVVLPPLVVAVGHDFGISVSGVGVARSILAGAAVVASLAVGPLIDRIGVSPLLLLGGALVFAGAAASAAAPSLSLFYAAHLLSGAGVGCLLSAGLAGVASFFDDHDVPRAMGYVIGAQPLAWIAGTPLIGVLAEAGSWRLAYAIPATASAIAMATGWVALRGVSRVGPELKDVRPDALVGLAAVFSSPSARQWALAEVAAYTAWTAELTYAGAFYIQSYGIGESAVGVLLAVGLTGFLAGSLSAARLTRLLSRRGLVAGSALGMAAAFPLILNLTPSAWFTLGLFCMLALLAGFRSASSSALGLSQLPDRPGSIMGVRSASGQLGYMLGAAIGGWILAVAGFGALGFVLCLVMSASALLVARVPDPVAKPLLGLHTVRHRLRIGRERTSACGVPES